MSNGKVKQRVLSAYYKRDSESLQALVNKYSWAWYIFEERPWIVILPERNS